MTPLMQQYWDIKNHHKDSVLLFRMGDFYEMFHADAELAAPLLGIALTVRNRKASDETKMCGVPHHSIAGPIAKLLAAGHKVAICDQIEDPATAKGIVKRAVTRILSPGMVYDPETLEQIQGHYLAAFSSDTVAFFESTTAALFFYRVANNDEAFRLLFLLQPKETLLTGEQRHQPPFDLEKLNTHLSVFGKNLAEVQAGREDWPEAALRLLAYAVHMQGPELKQAVKTVVEKKVQHFLRLTPQVQRHLEILQSYSGERKGSLFSGIDRTRSPGGARLLREWLQFPLLDQKQIAERQDQVEFWCGQSDALSDLRKLLQGLGDLERRIGKVTNPGCSPRDLLALSQSLRTAVIVAQMCPPGQVELTSLNEAKELVERLESILVAEPPLSAKQGGIFKTGNWADLDELIGLCENAQDLLNDLENREREAIGVNSAKVRFNNVFGYYIELTKTHSAKAPARYQRKQTLTNAERFTTPELNQLEEKILSANSRRSDLEFGLFNEEKQKILVRLPQLFSLARAINELDVITSLAWLANECRYVRPKFSTQGHLKLIGNRHPVVEQTSGTRFVPNDIILNQGQCLLLTGPNMAGKSTLMRQVAVAAIMAQIGSFVACTEAELPIYRRIFTRIGASDNLSEGLSTFMVEMKEAAEIMHEADAQSLVVLDEIGRGTSTYDGLSLAQAILEVLVTKNKPTTLFATHYHELSKLATIYPQVSNAHMSIQEKNGNISFLHTLTSGPASKSYGIHVAKLAGLPASVTERARKVLAELEYGQVTETQQMVLSAPTSLEPDPVYEELVKSIRQVQVQKLTPLEALNQIAQWQQNLS